MAGVAPGAARNASIQVKLRQWKMFTSDEVDSAAWSIEAHTKKHQGDAVMPPL